MTYGDGAVGAVGGALAGHRIGGATGPLLPSIFMKSTSTELLFDPTKQLQEKMVKEQMKHRPSLYGKIFGTTLGGFAGMELGKFGGEKLAILYIARKYGVSLNEAWLAIRLNRDLSKKIKK